MTKDQVKQFNKMREALLRIKTYQTLDRLRKNSEKDWGLNYDEALEMAYDNIQSEAAIAVKGVRVIHFTEKHPKF